MPAWAGVGCPIRKSSEKEMKMRAFPLFAGCLALLLPSALPAPAQANEEIDALFARVPALPADHPQRLKLLQDAAGAAGATAGPRLRPALAAGCERRTAAGHLGCLIVFADFNTAAAGDEALLITIAGPSELWGFQLSGNGALWSPYGLIWNSYDVDPTALIDDLHRNGVKLQPNPMQLLQTPRGASISLRPSF